MATACLPSAAYQASNVYRYHDTFPHPDTIPVWPELVPTMTPDQLPYMRERGLIVGALVKEALAAFAGAAAGGVEAERVVITGALQNHHATIGFVGGARVAESDVDLAPRSGQGRQCEDHHQGCHELHSCLLGNWFENSVCGVAESIKDKKRLPPLRLSPRSKTRCLTRKTQL